MAPAAGIVFTAHNRREMVLEGVRLAKAQTVPVEIIVCDDASSDGLVEALAAAHPDVRVIRSDVSRGPCFQRNVGVAAASSEIVFPLDDDSMLVSPRTIEQTLPEFDDPRVAVVAMPFQHVLQSPTVHQRRRGEERETSVNYAACAHAVRRSAFLELGGYPEEYFYMGEEGDLAIRLLEAGHRLVVGAADPVHHLQPPGRRSYKPDFYGRRNLLLFYFRHAPLAALPARVGGAIARGIVFGWRNRCLKATFDGIAEGLRLGLAALPRRRPVSPRTFAAFSACKRAETMPLAELERRLDG